MDGILICVGIVVVVILLALINFFSNQGSIDNLPTRRKYSNRVIGKVYACKPLGEGVYSLIVEFIVNGNTYRSVNQEFFRFIEFGTPMEVYYSETDPRDNEIGFIIDNAGNTACIYCNAPVYQDSVVCPNCNAVFDEKRFNSNPGQYMNSEKVFSHYSEKFHEENPFVYELIYLLITLAVGGLIFFVISQFM